MYKVLVDHQIRNFFDEGYLSLIDQDSKSRVTDNIQPSSFDIPLGKVGYAVRKRFSSFLMPISEVVDILKFETFDLEKGPATLYKGQTYMFPVLRADLPPDIHLEFSPKSSIGRIDLHVRVIADKSGLYDRTSEGYSGNIWVEVTPRSFNVIVHSGTSLTQMHIHKTIENEDSPREIDITTDKEILIEKGVALLDRQTLILGLDVPKKGVVGYEAKETNLPIDLEKTGKHEGRHFFKPVVTEHRKEAKVELVKDRFYILVCKSKVSVPGKYTAEMLPVSHNIGELRSHYAGYFDPGFGYGKKGEVGGNSGVLEVRPFETMTCYDSQPIALLRYYLNDSVCEEMYGFNNNNYQSQKGVELAKYFK